MPETLLIDVKDHVAHVQINRPKAMNALNFDLMRELPEAFATLDTDDDVNVIVLSGAGKHFGAGYDLKQDWGSRFGRDPLGARGMLKACIEFELTPWKAEKPVIAMVRGYCLAGSCELAMMCCITFAATGAMFGEPEIRFSTAPPALIMPWIVGLKKARELLYTGDLVTAEEAMRIGMVNRVYDEDKLEEETFKYARRAARIAPEGLKTTKASINKGAEIAGFLQALDAGQDLGAILDSTETATYKKFKEVSQREGLTAAIRWRESQFKDA